MEALLLDIQESCVDHEGDRHHFLRVRPPVGEVREGRVGRPGESGARRLGYSGVSVGG